MNKKVDYPYIRAWGQIMSSYQYYIEGEVEKARKDKAPRDAIYRNSTIGKNATTENGWETYRSISSLDTKRQVYRIVTKQFGEDIPEPTWRDTFQEIHIQVGDHFVIVPGLNNNNPADLIKLVQILQEFVNSKFPLSSDPGTTK